MVAVLTQTQEVAGENRWPTRVEEEYQKEIADERLFCAKSAPTDAVLHFKCG